MTRPQDAIIKSLSGQVQDYIRDLESRFGMANRAYLKLSSILCDSQGYVTFDFTDSDKHEIQKALALLEGKIINEDILSKDTINKIQTLIYEIECLYKITISDNRPPEYYKKIIQETKDWIGYINKDLTN